jgi:hypothetical protein
VWGVKAQLRAGAEGSSRNPPRCRHFPQAADNHVGSGVGGAICGAMKVSSLAARAGRREDGRLGGVVVRRPPGRAEARRSGEGSKRGCEEAEEGREGEGGEHGQAEADEEDLAGEVATGAGGRWDLFLSLRTGRPIRAVRAMGVRIGCAAVRVSSWRRRQDGSAAWTASATAPARTSRRRLRCARAALAAGCSWSASRRLSGLIPLSVGSS